MPLLRIQRYKTSGPSVPLNVATGDWIIEVSGTYTCGSTNQLIDLSSTTMTAGRWVTIKATTISSFTTATVTAPAGLTAVSATQESVLFGATTWQCIVVTLA